MMWINYWQNGWHGMWGWGWGFGGLIHLLFLAIVVFIIIRLFSAKGFYHFHQDNAIDILKKRYAKGNRFYVIFIRWIKKCEHMKVILISKDKILKTIYINRFLPTKHCLSRHRQYHQNQKLIQIPCHSNAF